MTPRPDASARCRKASLPGAGGLFERSKFGAIAQLGERVLCKHDVVGSIPSGSTISVGASGSRFSSRPARARQHIRVEEKKVPLRARLRRLTKLTS